MSFIAFLILTVDTPNSSIDYLINNNYNIYIHSKNEIDKKYEKYIIPKIAETSWCDIVEAQINLLEEALKNKKNKYFIMVSGNSYLLYNNNQFNNFDPTYSCFSFSNKYKLGNKKYYKSSTWWILNRTDAEIICNTREKYENEFKKFSECKEEYYFLTVLHNEIKNYIYINHKYTYTKWLFNLGMAHPITYNKLTNEDLNDIKLKDYMFMRKVLSTFKYEPITINNSNLYILCIGTKTKQSTIDYFINKNNIDFIIVSLIPINEINSELTKKCISIFGSIHYNEYYNFILDLCTYNNYYLQQWNENIIFIPENFNIKNYIKTKKMTTIPYNEDKFKIYKFFLNNKKLFNEIIDDEKNKGYYIQTTKLKELSLSSFKIDFDNPL